MPNLDQTLEELGSYTDDLGRVYSSHIERGSDNVPKVVPGLDTASLKELGTEDIGTLNNVVGKFGLTNSPEQMLDMQSSMLQAFSSRPGSPMYETDLMRLKEGMEGRVLLGQSRRVSERFETLTAIDGNMSQEMIYLNEGDDPCDGCAPLGGETMTYAEFIQNDMLPGSQCYGGDLCLCQLMAIK